jgi:uncharacterized protein (DUF2267 family)
METMDERFREETGGAEAELVRQMREAAPFSSDAEAGEALRATVERLARLLTTEERAAFASPLPERLGALVRAVSVGPSPKSVGDPAIEALAAGEDSRAVEAAEVACRVIGRAVGAPVRARLAVALPGLARFFEPPVKEDPPPIHAGHPPRIPHDLAEGRAGGNHPLADADPRELAHRHSVARSDDPHADTKLSSARGVSQERAGHTISSGEPGSGRPLSRDH